MNKPVLAVISIIIAACCVLSSCLGSNHSEANYDTGFFSISGGSESEAKFKSILRQIEDWVSEGDIVGAEMMVIENTEIIIHEAYGWMDKDENKPMEKNTIFRIRSMTKPFIAASILMLTEEGKLNIEDTVSKYLPAFNNSSSSSVTIEHLLTHTGGFSQPGFPRDYETYNDLREAADDIGTIGPQYMPGTQYLYSDAGVAVLGAVIAEISGMPVEEYIQKKILTPLEMTDTYCNLVADKNIKDRISATYYRDGNKYVKYWDSSKPQSASYFRASGGMYSTPLDYAKFLYMWMNKGSIDSRIYLSEQSIIDALTPSSHNDQYGYLWETGQTFGHGGSDGTIAFALPEKNLMVLYFTQSRSTHTTEVIKSMVLEEFGANESNPKNKIEVDAEYYDNYIGRYANSQVEIEITTNGESLLVKTADSSNQVFIPTAEDIFSHEIIDIQLTFQREASGEVTRAIIYQRGETIEVEKMK